MIKMNRPTLILLVGIPGSGKTTHAEKYIQTHRNTIHLASDKIREELWGNEAIQGDNNEVFSLMQKRAIDALNNGLSVVYDSTAITRKARASIIAACPKFVKIECHIVWAPIETCIERDAARERTVGKEVIDRMLKRFQAPYYDEGIHAIEVVWPDGFTPLMYRTYIYKSMCVEHDNPNHTLNIVDHCVEAGRYVFEHFKNDNDLFIAALWHDVGKPYVKAFVDSKGNPCEIAHYYQHQCLSAWMVYGIESNAVDIAWLVSTHMDPFLNTKYYNKLPVYLKQKIDMLHKADKAAH